MAFNKDKVMDAARKFVDKGQIDKAVKEYLRIVHEDPKDVRVWLKIGDLYAKKGAKQDATDTYLKVARFYHEQGFFLKAVAVYKQILKLDPRLVDVILKLAELYRQLGLMSDAMQHFESVAAHFHREGNTKEALETVKKLVDLDPENIATRIKLAELYSKEGLVEEASAEFTLACDQLRRQNRQDDFVKVAERLLWHKPENHALNRELAGLYLRRNDPRRALQKLQACFKADPRDVETLGLLAQAFQALDQKAKTVSVLKELARIHVENKQRDKATEVFRKILEFVPNDPDAMQFLNISSPQVAAPGPQHQQLVAPPPMAPQAPPQAPPPVRPPTFARAQTPMPPAVRAADARFQLTGDMPAIPAPASQRMTGSMPLVDEQSLSGVDFALPEYDDADFSADMEPPPDPRRASAAGERHAEEISKILAETDVYVKYGLHQKAVDHLRRIFTLDGENVEAHERLKDIFVSQGREHEAETELLKLAELVASGDPDRAEQYLQELLAINGTHTGAFDLARRFRLRVARTASSEVEYAGGAGSVAAIDAEMDLDELDLISPPRSPVMGIARSTQPAHHDSIDDFDALDLVGGHSGGAQHANGNGMAHGSPAPARPPGPPRGAPPSVADHDNFDLEFEPQSQATRQMSPEHADALANLDAELDDEPIGAPRSAHPYYGNGAAAGPSLDDAVDAQLDDASLGEDIDQGVAAELGAASDDMPFDPDEARAFDQHVQGGTYDPITGYEETDLPRVGPGGNTDHFDDMSDEGLSVAGGYDPYGTASVQTPAYADPTAAHHIDSTGNVDLEDDLIPVETDVPAAGGRAESSVEDELDAADFYVGQGMYVEALDVLHELLTRYPNHRLISTKLRDVQAMASETPPGGSDHMLDGDDELDDPIEVVAGEGTDSGGQVIAGDDSDGTEALDLDDLEGTLHDDESPLVAASPSRKMPQVTLEKPVEDNDAETHFDLGLAYKEMGLFDEAVKAFDKTLRAPGREVKGRLMIGMCHREQGNASEAIHQFKQGLHSDTVSEAERQSLYYEIGQTYEAIGDDTEALYYFELVLKRDPTFADAATHANQLRPRVGRNARPPIE